MNMAAPGQPVVQATSDQTTPATAPAAPPAGEDDDAAAQSPGRTPEEIEAFWRNRVSKKDKAHLAAEQALRDEIASLSRQRVAATQSSSTSGNDDPNTERVAELQRQLEQERQARVIDQRKAKYPALAKQGVTDSIFASGDEATLARLNALADDNADGGFIAPTAPRRAAPVASKPLNEKSKDELLADLRVASTHYEASLRNR